MNETLRLSQVVVDDNVIGTGQFTDHCLLGAVSSLAHLVDSHVMTLCPVDPVLSTTSVVVIIISIIIIINSTTPLHMYRFQYFKPLSS